jgi:hypothetical protein
MTKDAVKNAMTILEQRGDRVTVAVVVKLCGGSYRDVGPLVRELKAAQLEQAGLTDAERLHHVIRRLDPIVAQLERLPEALSQADVQAAQAEERLEASLESLRFPAFASTYVQRLAVAAYHNRLRHYQQQLKREAQTLLTRLEALVHPIEAELHDVVSARRSTPGPYNGRVAFREAELIQLREAAVAMQRHSESLDL